MLPGNGAAFQNQFSFGGSGCTHQPLKFHAGIDMGNDSVSVTQQGTDVRKVKSGCQQNAAHMDFFNKIGFFKVDGPKGAGVPAGAAGPAGKVQTGC